MRRIDAAAQPWATAEPGPGGELQRESRPADLVADLLVPLGQAGVTGSLVGGLIAYAVKALGYPGEILPLAGGLALAIAAGTWLLLLSDVRRRLLWAVERVTGQDLNHDGATGDPTKRVLEVHVKDGGQTRIVGADWLGIDDDRLIAFARGVIGGRGLAEGAWAKDKTAFPKGINEYRKLRGRLLEAGLIQKVSAAGNVGFELTHAGRAVLGRLAALTLTHTNGGPEHGRPQEQ